MDVMAFKYTIFINKKILTNISLTFTRKCTICKKEHTKYSRESTSLN